MTQQITFLEARRYTADDAKTHMLDARKRYERDELKETIRNIHYDASQNRNVYTTTNELYPKTIETLKQKGFNVKVKKNWLGKFIYTKITW